MKHPTRTLLYELFIEPLLRLLSRPEPNGGQVLLTKATKKAA